MTEFKEEENRYRPGHSTGPRTGNGKTNSSRNSLVHGCCSNRLILPGENQEEFDDLKQGWLDDYDPHTQIARSLVAKAAEAEWLLLRNLHWHHECEQELYAENPNPLSWSEGQHKKLERFLRYRTTAERAFSRALGQLEHLRKSRSQESALRRREKERAAKSELQVAKDTEKRVKAEQKSANPEAAEKAEVPETEERGENERILTEVPDEFRSEGPEPESDELPLPIEIRPKPIYT